jgi:hypothetical protein
VVQVDVAKVEPSMWNRFDEGARWAVYVAQERVSKTLRITRRLLHTYSESRKEREQDQANRFP